MEPRLVEEIVSSFYDLPTLPGTEAEDAMSIVQRLGDAVAALFDGRRIPARLRCSAFSRVRSLFVACGPGASSIFRG